MQHRSSRQRDEDQAGRNQSLTRRETPDEGPETDSYGYGRRCCRLLLRLRLLSDLGHELTGVVRLGALRQPAGHGCQVRPAIWPLVAQSTGL